MFKQIAACRYLGISLQSMVLLSAFALTVHTSFAQLVAHKTEFNIGGVDQNSNYLKIYLFNKSSENIYSIDFLSHLPENLSGMEVIRPGEVSVLRVRLSNRGTKKINETIQLQINRDDAPISIRVKGRYDIRSGSNKQNCPDFSNSKRNWRLKNPDKKSRSKQADIMVELHDSSQAEQEAIPTSEYMPNNLVILLDASSSMKEEQKKELLNLAFSELTKVLRPVDQITIIAYANEPEVLLPPQKGAAAEELINLIEGIESSGYTNGSLGIKNAYLMADSIFDPEANNEIILATDGAFNLNETNDIIDDIMVPYTKKGIRLSILGIRNKHWAANEMKQLTVAGRGTYVHVRSNRTARNSLKKTIKIHSKK